MEGRLEGRLEEKKQSILDFLNDLGDIPQVLKDTIMSENRIDILRSMMKIAANATSFSDFEEKISKL